jgi:uncharacterized Zn finger protein
MSPFSERGWYQAKPRVAVQGGVSVAKPGRVSDPDALELLAAAEMETKPSILSRGRTYARAGQVLNVETDGDSFTASIQGSDRTPYQVELTRTMISGSDRIHASCTCPYSCDYDWCKHAAALAYVAAYLIDNQPATRAVWTGEQPPQAVEPLSDEDLQTLRTPAPAATFAERLAQAEAVVPWGRAPSDW